MTTAAKEYLVENNGKRVKFVVDYNAVVRGICEIAGNFVRIYNKSRYRDLGGYATFGMPEILSEETMTMEESKQD